MKKILLLIGILATNLALAGNSETISENQARDILKYIKPTSVNQVLGSWKKVLQGPAGDQLGVYNPDGIAEGEGQKVMSLQISGTDFSSWMPREVSEVYAVGVRNFIVPVINGDTISEKPKLMSNPLVVLTQEGEFVRFSLKLTYNYKVKKYYTRSNTLIPGLIFTIDTKVHYEDSEFVWIELNYACALQSGNADRLICQQSGDVRASGEKYIKERIISQMTFSNLVAFERVK